MSSIDDFTGYNPFNLDHQWKVYLIRVGLNESRMSDTQLHETKKSFYAGCSQMLIMMRDDIGKLNDETAKIVFESIYEQLDAFWHQEQQRYNEMRSARNN